MYELPLKRETLTSRSVVVPAFILLGVAETFVRYLNIVDGTQKSHIDVRCCWRPLAEAVLAGHPIYVRPAVDNKPPLFEMLNVAVAATGEYLLVFLLLVGLANAAGGLLLWRIGARRGAPRVGLIAGFLFLATVPIAGGIVVNVRSFAVAGVLLSLSATHPAARGGALAAAALFSQHAVFAAPALAYDRVRELDRGAAVRWLAVFALAGLGVLAASFGAVYAVWGWPSLRGALYWSFGAATKYTTNPSVPSLIGETDRWIIALYNVGSRLFHLIVPAALVAAGALVERDGERPLDPAQSLVPTATLLALSMTAPLFVRAYRAYWLYSLPFLALLASVAYRRFFAGDGA